MDSFPLFLSQKTPKPKPHIYSLGFPCGLAGKATACNAVGLGSIPGLGRSPGEGKGQPLQYSGLENSGHGFVKSWTRLSDFHFHFHIYSLFQLLLIFQGGDSFSSLGVCQNHLKTLSNKIPSSTVTVQTYEHQRICVLSSFPGNSYVADSQTALKNALS